MFGLRSARSRAVLAGVVLVLVLAAVATVAILRVRLHQDRLLALESTATSVAALEHARAQFFLETTAVSALIFTQDPVLAERYEAAAAALRLDLSQARAEMIASGKADDLAALDKLTEQIDALEATIDGAMPVLLAGDQEEVLALANIAYLELWPSIDSATNDLEALADAEQSELAAARVEANRAADITSWIVVGFGGGALMLATAMVVVTIASVVRPLASLRASARAITSGDLKARAKVSGPEEVASLARDFNEMTDALWAKTQEYIDTSNLTGDIIIKIDKHGRWVFLNDSACQFYGKPREELLGTDSRPFVHSEDKERTLQMGREARAGKELIRGFVNRQITPMGTRVVEWNGYAFFDEEGQYAGLQGTGRDITERQRAEEELQESEERFRSLSASAPIGVFLTDLQGDCVYANSRLQAISGLTLEESLGYGWTKVIHPDDRPALVEAAEKAVRRARDFSYEYRIVTPEGELRWAHVHTSPMFSTQSKEVGRVGTLEDITERKRAEEALRESEERLRILFEFAPDAYYLHDLEGNFADGNRAAVELTGYKREELIGKSLLKSNLLPPEQLPKAAATVAKLVQGALAGPDEFTLIRKDGRHVAVETRGFPVEIGGQTLILGIARDITERKRAEEALQSSEDRLRILFEFAPDAYYLNDLQGNFVDGNKAAEEITGYKREELIGKNMLELKLLPPEQIAKAAAALGQHAQGKPAGPNEFALNRKDSSQVPVEIRAFPVKIKEQTLVLGIARDISERKRAEEVLRESEERYRNLFDSTHDMIQSVAPDGRLLFANRVWLETLGYTEAELPGLSLLDIIHPESLSHCQELFSKIVAGESIDHVEATFVAKDGRLIAVEGHASARHVGGRVVATHGFFRDVTERKHAEQERERLNAELELRAITDSLTGLYDHAHFYQRLAEEIDRSKRYKHGFAVVMMDIDDFKRFNDSRGHQVGDEMLRLVARCIPAGLRRSDLAFRYGGDEFAAILPHADPSKARAAVDRINKHIVKRLKQMDGGAGVRLSLSAGVACFPDDGTTADELVRIADAALYNAKWLARARDIMGQREDIQSLVSALVSRQGGAVFRPEALHEQQARIVSSVASSITVALKDAGVAQALEDPDLQVLATVGAAAEIKDRYMRGHPERMSERAAALAEEMGFSPERVRDIRIAGLLHDIGKITVSEGILNKPGKLTRREFDSIKDHPIVGATLVSQVKGFERLVPIVRHHHERFDGTGYPDGLAGEDIPPEARILSVLDVFDALTHQRSYRKAQSQEEAIAELERGAGTQFDPAVVKAFLALVKRRGQKRAAPAQAAGEDKPLVAAPAAGRPKR